MAIAKSEMIRGVYVTPVERRKRRKEADEAERAKEIITVARLGEMWLYHLRAIGRTHSTIVTYQNILENHITSQIGFRDILSINQQDVNVLLAVGKPGA